MGPISYSMTAPKLGHLIESKNSIQKKSKGIVGKFGRTKVREVAGDGKVPSSRNLPATVTSVAGTSKGKRLIVGYVGLASAVAGDSRLLMGSYDVC